MSSGRKFSDYGAFQLKRAYRKNLVIGIGLACLMNLMIIGGILLISCSHSKPIEPVEPKAPSGPIQLGRPPGFSEDKVIFKFSAIKHIEQYAGVPVPIPDNQAPEGIEIATTDELKSMAIQSPVLSLEQVGVENFVIENVDSLLPLPNEFVAYEEAPMKIEDGALKYPEMARRAGIEGTVWIQALIDEEGKVRDVIIARESGMKAGFEEAAIAQAYGTSWKPAISNDQPVAVWVTYKVEFKLR